MTIKEILREERTMRKRMRELKRISRAINKRVKLRKQYDALGEDISKQMLDYHHKYYQGGNYGADGKA